MKKIFNWTFGGFFRTIGRTLAFLLLGALIVIIAQKNDVKITEILGIEHVNAATTNAPITSKRQLVKYCNVNIEECQWLSGDINTQLSSPGTVNGTVVSYITELSWRVESSDGYNANTPYNFSAVTTFSRTPVNLTTFTKYFQLEVWTSTNQDGSNALKGTSNNNVMNFSCNVGLTADETGFTINCVFTPNRKIKRFQIFWKLKNKYYTPATNALRSIDTQTGWVKWTNYNFTYNQDESAVINSQTQIIQDQTNQIIDINNQTYEAITDDNVDGGTSEASSFFSNFTTNNHGLTGIITAPLNTIQSLSSATCSPLVLPLPFVNQNLTLPCMRQIYDDNFGSFMNIYDVVTLGIISYWIMVRIFALVKDFKNPDHDEIEVVDL